MVREVCKWLGKYYIHISSLKNHVNEVKILKSKLEKLKLFSSVFFKTFVFFMIIMFAHIIIKFIEIRKSNVHSEPNYFVIVYGLYYVIPIIISYTIHIVCKYKIRKLEQLGDIEAYPSSRLKLTVLKSLKKIATKKVLLFILFISTLVCIIIPSIVIYVFVNKHVNYTGNTAPPYPLQGIYTAKDFGISSNEITIATEDNIDLWVSEVTVEEPKAIIIYISGIVQPSVTYYYGHAKWMKENNYASFLLELRGHGRSEGDKICLGYEETKDVKALVRYIKMQEKYKELPIILQGASMGGAVAVNAFGSIEEISGLIAMSAYSSFEDVIYDYMKNNHVPRFISNFGRLITRIGLQFNFGNLVNTMTPINHIQNSNGRPVFLIASKGDTSVPYQNTLRLKEKLGDCELWIRDSDAHFIIENTDFINFEQDEEYCSRILTFLEEKVVQ